MKISKDHLEAYFEHGLDLTNRRVFLLSDISEDGVGAAVQGLRLLAEESETKPVELWIGSFGGSEYEMFALFDTTRTIKCPVHTVAVGKCMSAAPLLVAAGERGQRWAMPNCFFMVHESWGEWNGRADAVERELRHQRALSKRWYDEMARLTNKTAAWWRREIRKPGDYYFDAERAQELGVIDHLWSEKDA